MAETTGLKGYDMRALLERAYRAALAAADPERIVPGHLPAPPAGRLLVVGAGKAAAAMAAAIDRHYPEEVPLGGAVIVPDGHELPAGRVEVLAASHPVPDWRGVAATERILAAVEGCGEDDRVVVLISGGASALLAAPEGLGLGEKAALTRELLRSGADIGEINAVRKHLSRVKGGLLGLAAGPAPTTALLLSDVVGDDPTTIGSGPTVADPTCFADALAVLDRYRLHAPAARASLEAGVRGERRETPKPGDGGLEHVETRIVGNNQRSLEAAAAVLEGAGLAVHILSSSITGEARVAGALHGAVARQILERGQPFPPPCALISGGETTVTVRGDGRGGRNGEFCLGLALELPIAASVAALAADTDGIDGSEENAGALLTVELLAGIDRRRGRELLAANDSYTFFAEADHLFVTGPTGTNVNDLRIVVLGAPRPTGGSR